ncbi:alpha/beta hydrolase [Sphingomonas sp. BK235]|jgi:acetyl esterase/lipase|uniref:alpha/beta hydrolase n=1 Tax=Sphingomonas sp. BK235 TaxID=2512131 RepID=UPI00104616B4|nr:alpha/beta hydrolase [Sphingomonas sp. BK235]TCP31058.1 acetyl esterase/lipase [Sphingomonas sp. BK235]
MDTLHLVAPAYRDAAAVIPVFDTETQSIDQIREGLSRAYEQAYGSPDLVDKEEVFIERTVDEPVRALLFQPQGRPVRGAILHIHGGGWLAGSPDMFAAFCADISERHAVVVLSVDYRLVPEAPGDAALDDCFEALSWLHAHAVQLGFTTDRVSIMGDSAGGNLSAATALRARDAGVPVRSQLLIYPAFDDRTAGPDAPVQNPFAGEFVLTPRYTRQLWKARLAKVTPESLPYLAPARNEHLAGLAPAFIAMGSLDILIDEALEYAGRLIRSGVPTELHVYDGVFHGFDLVPGPETNAFRADLARAIERALI